MPLMDLITKEAIESVLGKLVKTKKSDRKSIKIVS